MTIKAEALALQIEIPFISPSSPNFRPDCWPPSDDFPVVIDSEGNVVSRYGDHEWQFWPWTGSHNVVNFCDGPVKRKNSPVLSKPNADLLRCLAAWWLYGPRAVNTATSLIKRVSDIRSIFVLCTLNGVTADMLYKFPKVSDQISRSVKPSSRESVLQLLHSVYEQRDQIGFMILDKEGARRLASSIPNHNAKQTPYVPPRIWKYQLDRLREFLDDFHSHKEQIEACYNFCLDAYVKNFGPLDTLCNQNSKKRSTWSRPFQPGTPLKGRITGAVFHGQFSETAKNFGIDALLRRWVSSDGQLDGVGQSVALLSKYFSMTTAVGAAYITNFSIMRIEEVWTLRSDCFKTEIDPEFGPIHMINGATHKTIKDDDAIWITSASAKLAVDAMACVARLRMVCACANPEISVPNDVLKNPWLTTRSYEPWTHKKNSNSKMSVRPTYPSYGAVINNFPNLFDENQMTIKDDDLKVAIAITPSLDKQFYKVGAVWPLAWHQLRRTGAVNMQASDLVSDASLQYQLKHLTRTMSLYYGRGYSRLRLNNSACGEYIRTMYEMVAREMGKLLTHRFLSPHGEDRKQSILNLVTVVDVEALSKAAAAKKVHWRETFFGVCTMEGACEYGGWDDVSHCGGQTKQGACIHSLIDRKKEGKIRSLLELMTSRLLKATPDSPLYRSLNAQRNAIENILNVIGQN
ncbi:hypothetical protein ACLHS5_33950 [Pseudomonas aeruginosa]|uniref:hypothetical protein n=1 Tax=Pseudomonas aeruginosa TaxID=287 RepID=UPI003983C360|nr:hypothetical protein [Pseudomonas aeruginosa]HCF9438173.1 hypothetical protein [Pseudomonas aeruginosa]